MCSSHTSSRLQAGPVQWGSCPQASASMWRGQRVQGGSGLPTSFPSPYPLLTLTCVTPLSVARVVRPSSSRHHPSGLPTTLSVITTGRSVSLCCARRSDSWASACCAGVAAAPLRAMNAKVASTEFCTMCPPACAIRGWPFSDDGMAAGLANRARRAARLASMSLWGFGPSSAASATRTCLVSDATSVGASGEGDRRCIAGASTSHAVPPPSADIVHTQ